MAQRRSDRRVILTSACLLGVRCNHAGGASPSAAVARLGADHVLVPICPEVAGGLPIPRPAAELQPNSLVVTSDGADVTDAYWRGAVAAVAAARGGRRLCGGEGPLAFLRGCVPDLV